MQNLLQKFEIRFAKDLKNVESNDLKPCQSRNPLSLKMFAAPSRGMPGSLLHLLLLSESPLTLSLHGFKLGAQFSAFGTQLLDFLTDQWGPMGTPCPRSCTAAARCLLH